jgi:hypothetical protein
MSERIPKAPPMTSVAPKNRQANPFMQSLGKVCAMGKIQYLIRLATFQLQEAEENEQEDTARTLALQIIELEERYDQLARH